MLRKAIYVVIATIALFGAYSLFSWLNAPVNIGSDVSVSSDIVCRSYKEEGATVLKLIGSTDGKSKVKNNGSQPVMVLYASAFNHNGKSLIGRSDHFPLATGETKEVKLKAKGMQNYFKVITNEEFEAMKKETENNKK